LYEKGEAQLEEARKAETKSLRAFEMLKQILKDARWGALRRGERPSCTRGFARVFGSSPRAGTETPELWFTNHAADHTRIHQDGTIGAAVDRLRVTAATVAHDDCCPRRQMAGWLAALLIRLAYSSAARFDPPSDRSW